MSNLRIENGAISAKYNILPYFYFNTNLFIQNFVRAKRFFVGEPVWTPYNRPADEMDCRKTYEQLIKSKWDLQAV